MHPSRRRVGRFDSPLQYLNLIFFRVDVELPLEVDDEYLAERKQPEGKPSQLSYFVSAIKLVQIAGLILRTIVRTFSVARLTVS